MNIRYQGIYQWTINLQVDDDGEDIGEGRLQMKFGPSAWKANEQDTAWRHTVDLATADYSHLFLTRARFREVRQSAVTLQDVLHGLSADDRRLHDEIVAFWRYTGRLRSLTPGVAGVRADVTRIRQLLNDGALSGAPDRAVVGALLGASRAFDDIAHWNAHTLEHVVARDLWVAGQELPRDLVTDNHELARARLSGRLVAAPPSIARDIAEVYGRLSGPSGFSTSAAAAPHPTRSHHRQDPPA